MTSLTSLIERIEAATGEDAVIYAALVYAQDNSWINIDQYVNAQDWRCHGAFFEAVMTLLPEGYDWIIGNVNGHYGGTPYACVGSTEQHYAATPCLALLAAILRARQTEVHHDES